MTGSNDGPDEGAARCDRGVRSQRLHHTFVLAAFLDSCHDNARRRKPRTALLIGPVKRLAAVCVRLVVLAAALLPVWLASQTPAVADAAIEYHEVTRFGGFDAAGFQFGGYGHALAPGELLEATGFAVDPVDNTVYVADRVSSVEAARPRWRIQKLDPERCMLGRSVEGCVLGTTEFSLPGGRQTSSTIAGLAVDPKADEGAGRLYALVMGPVRVANSYAPNATAAQELLAWSVKPEPCEPGCGPTGGALVAAPGEKAPLPIDPLGSTGGLVSNEAQLNSGPTPLYDPQGLAVDRLEQQGAGGPVDNPIVIEASDLAGSNPANEFTPVSWGLGYFYTEFETKGNTIVQQVLTRKINLFEKTGFLVSPRWSSSTVSAALGGSWGPRGIFDDAGRSGSGEPDRSISVLLHGSELTPTNAYVVKLSPDLKEQLVLNRDGGEPAQAAQAPMHLDAGPFFTDTLSSRATQLQPPNELRNAGPEVAQLENNLYAADFYLGEPECENASGYWHSEPQRPCVKREAKNGAANIGVRLLEPYATGVISSPAEGAAAQQEPVVATTLGNEDPPYGASPYEASPCSIGAEDAALAAGSKETLWVLDRGPTSESLVNQGAELLVQTPEAETRRGRQIIELAPGAGPGACPHPSGTFTMRLACGEGRSGEISAPQGEKVTFDASSVNVPHVAPFAYEWEFEAEGSHESQLLSTHHAAFEHVFSAEGSYRVQLKVLSDYGTYRPPPATVKVTSAAAAAPHAQFEVTSPTGAQQATFDASASAPGTCNTITNYLWSWGDGSSTEDDEEADVVHTYAASGSYAVRLTVINNHYQRSAPSNPLLVTVSPPTTLVATEPAPPIAPTTVASSPPGPAPPGPARGPTRLIARASFSAGVIRTAVSCPAVKVSCVGSVRIETAAALPANPPNRHAGGRVRRLVLGQAPFSLAGGRSRTLTMRLAAKGVTLLRRLGRLPILVVVSARDPLGDPGVATVHLTLISRGRRLGTAP